MINKTLDLIKEYLNCVLGSEVVLVDRFPDQDDGKEHHIIITLLRIEEETSRKPSNSVYYKEFVDTDGKTKKIASNKKSPDLDINLDILISSNGKDYKNALELMSKVISGINSIHTVQKPSKMNKDRFEQLRSLNISIQNLSLEQTLSMWQALHGKPVPAVAYKVRMLTVTGQLDKEPQPPVREVDLERVRINEDGKGPRHLLPETEVDEGETENEQQSNEQ